MEAPNIVEIRHWKLHSDWEQCQVDGGQGTAKMVLRKIWSANTHVIYNVPPFLPPPSRHTTLMHYHPVVHILLFSFPRLHRQPSTWEPCSISPFSPHIILRPGPVLCDTSNLWVTPFPLLVSLPTADPNGLFIQLIKLHLILILTDFHLFKILLGA